MGDIKNQIDNSHSQIFLTIWYFIGDSYAEWEPLIAACLMEGGKLMENEREIQWLK